MLYTRPAFLAVFFSLCFVVLVVLAIAHAVEWTVHRRRAAARHSASSDKLSHREAAFDRLTAASTADDISNERQPLLGPFGGHSTASTKAHDRQHPEKRLLLFAGLAYGSCSGALSGLGLLFAKTGVELLTLSLFGHHQNQFVHWQAWMIVLVLLVTDLTQLWYLNHSLRLLGPTLICPLACCFFNLSSIFNGLGALGVCLGCRCSSLSRWTCPVFYNQWAYLTPLKTSMLSLGIVVLLAGVWVVSLMPGPPPASTRGDAAAEGTEEAVELFEEPLLGEEAGPYDWDNGRPGTTAATASSSSRLHPNRLLALKHMLLEEAPRGFRIGLAASSPGKSMELRAWRERADNLLSRLCHSTSRALPTPFVGHSRIFRSSTVCERATQYDGLPLFPARPPATAQHATSHDLFHFFFAASAVVELKLRTSTSQTKVSGRGCVRWPEKLFGSLGARHRFGQRGFTTSKSEASCACGSSKSSFVASVTLFFKRRLYFVIRNPKQMYLPIL